MRLAITGLSGARVACPSADLTDQEDQFLAALQGSTLWTADPSQMVFRGDNAIVTVTWEPTAGG